MKEWEDTVSESGIHVEDLTQGQTPSPPYLPEPPVAGEWQDVIKGFTPPPPPVLPNSPTMGTNEPIQTAPQSSQSAASQSPPDKQK